LNSFLFDITIVGGGIVGVASAYKLQQKYPKLKLLLVEKERELAFHQTGRNSGVIHSGLYYKPGSLRARLCSDGRKQLVAFAKKYKVRHDVCGKVVAATNKNELPYLDKIFSNGIQNNIEGIEKINAAQLKEIEPFVESIGGIRVPCTGIIDFKGATKTMADAILGIQQQSKIVLGEEVIGYKHDAEFSTIKTSKQSYSSKHIVFCGGLQADRLAKKDKLKLKQRIVGFRGDYYNLTESAKYKVKHLIYPVPNPAFPFLGVHFTRMVNGDIECGPNAVLSFKREGYRKTDFSWSDSYNALTYSGTWNLLRNHSTFALNEYRRAFSKALFLRTLQTLIPSLTSEDIVPGRSGVRAMLLKENGEMHEDFKIVYNRKSIHVLNAPSPAATACLAIGDQICKMATNYFNLN